jgi:carbon-monoxide dehydrogenase small subunit
VAIEVQKTFELKQPPARVWDAFADVHLVAACLPGASIVEDRGGGQYKGRFAVKVGPLAASFDGDVAIERREEARTGTVSGKGADAKSGSRASGKLTYAVQPAGAGTRVEVVCEVNLAGALAQFGKAAVIKEIANRLTSEFVRNLDGRLGADATLAAASAAPAAPRPRTAPPAAQPLDAGRLGWSIFRDWIIGCLRALLGRKAQH